MKLKYILILIVPVFVFSKPKIDINPIAYGMNNTQGGMWTEEKKPITLVGGGLRAEIDYNNFHIYSEFVENLFYNFSQKPSDFTKSQGISWKQDREGNKYFFDVARMKIEYDYKDFTVQMGKFNRKWGPGISSLTLSDKPPSYSQVGFEWDITDDLEFTYMHGKLNSSLTDSSRLSHYDYVGQRDPEISRYIVAHRLTWQIIEPITVGATEGVTYGSRGLDLNYAMPFLFYWSAEHYIGDKDNVYLSSDITVRPYKNLKLYGTFYMDEWKPEWTFKEKERNWFGYQGGLQYSDIYLPEDRFRIEYNWTDYRIYRHRFPVNDFYSEGYPTNFWAGPHAQELYLDYSFKWRKIAFNLSYSNAKRGELTKEMLRGQYRNEEYERFSGLSESRQVYNLKIDRKLWNNLNVHLGLSRIIWNNANFDPSQPDETQVKDVTKTNVTLGILYNIDYKRFAEL